MQDDVDADHLRFAPVEVPRDLTNLDQRKPDTRHKGETWRDADHRWHDKSQCAEHPPHVKRHVWNDLAFKKPVVIQGVTRVT